MKDYKLEIEKIARKLLDEDMVKDTINRHLVNMRPDIVEKDHSYSKSRRAFSMPWNENIQVETYLKDKGNKAITSEYFLPDEDGPIVSNLIRKGVPFSNKTRKTVIMPNEIRLKDKYKGKGLGTSTFFALENAGKELGANKLEVIPDDEGIDVWSKNKFGLSVSKEDSKEFMRAAKKYSRKNKLGDTNKSLVLADHNPDFVRKYLRDNRMMVSLEKDI